MATSSNTQQRNPREIVDFALNVPVTVALKYNQGKLVAGQYGERMMFSLCDGRIIFLDPATAGQISALGINVRENFTITQRWDAEKGSRTWEVARIAGEQPNGTYVVLNAAPSPAPASSGPSDVTPKPRVSATAAVPNGARDRRASMLVEEAVALVDAFAQVLEHALTTHQGRVKPEEVKSIFLTCAINLAGGKNRAA